MSVRQTPFGGKPPSPFHLAENLRPPSTKPLSPVVSTTKQRYNLGRKYCFRAR